MNTQSAGRFIRPALRVFWMSAAFQAALVCPVLAQAPAFSISPMRQDVELGPGAEKTVAFEVKAGPSATGDRGRLVVTPTDWRVEEDGALTFSETKSEPASASSWIDFSPAALTIEPGRTQLIRITVAVPPGTAPGTYRTALFVQERPAATAPEGEVRAIFVRVRFVYLLYVVVTPATSQPDLVNVEIDTSTSSPRLICEMTNAGNRHARPLIFWTLKRGAQALGQGTLHAAVVLPGAKVREPHSLEGFNLTPGSYEMSVNVDFQDGRPQQAMTPCVRSECARGAGPGDGESGGNAAGTAQTVADEYLPDRMLCHRSHLRPYPRTSYAPGCPGLRSAHQR